MLMNREILKAVSYVIFGMGLGMIVTAVSLYEDAKNTPEKPKSRIKKFKNDDVVDIDDYRNKIK
jgi:hypothetical protein